MEGKVQVGGASEVEGPKEIKGAATVEGARVPPRWRETKIKVQIGGQGPKWMERRTGSSEREGTG